MLKMDISDQIILFNEHVKACRCIEKVLDYLTCRGDVNERMGDYQGSRESHEKRSLRHISDFNRYNSLLFENDKELEVAMRKWYDHKVSVYELYAKIRELKIKKLFVDYYHLIQ